jgi:hypothetical protein
MRSDKLAVQAGQERGHYGVLKKFRKTGMLIDVATSI